MKKINWYLLAVTASLLTLHTRAQNVGINEDGSAPNPNAILDVKSFSKGILIPRVSTAGRLAIPGTKGLLVYDSTVNQFMYNDGSHWTSLTPSAPAAWLVNGNAGLDSNAFIGTTDGQPLRFKAGGLLAGSMDPSRKVTFLGLNAGVNTGSGINNTGIGVNSLMNNTIGQNNTAIGNFSLMFNTTGLGNTASGFNSLDSNTTGDFNTAVGYIAMTHKNAGDYNTAVGAAALFSNSSGRNNTANGNEAMEFTTTGTDNAALGNQALSGNVTGSFNTAIGANADIAAGNLSNATAIGSGAVVNASNKIRIGNSAVTVIEGQVPFTTPSDGRFKYQVREDVKGLDFILQLRPVTYQFDVKRFDEQGGNPNGAKGVRPASYSYSAKEAYAEASRIRRSGFIAQEVERAAAVSGYDFSGIVKPATEEGHYSLSYESFVVPLVKGMQEQQRIIVALQQQIDELKKLLTRSK